MSRNEPDRQIRGSCHCGNIRFTLDWPSSQLILAARACNCEHCTKHGAAWTSNPQGRFTLQIADDTKVSRYRFGTQTADFHVCSMCGVVPIVTCSIAGRRYAVVNTNTLDDFDRSKIAVSIASFDEETSATRLERRQRTWTPERVL